MSKIITGWCKLLCLIFALWSFVDTSHSAENQSSPLLVILGSFYALHRFVTFTLTYSLTPWSRVLLEKLTGFQLVRKYPAFYGTWRFITAFTSVRQLSLFWASSIQSYTLSTSWRFILILSTHLCLCLPNSSFPQVSPPNSCIRLSSPPYAPHARPISIFSILSPAKYWVRITDH